MSKEENNSNENISVFEYILTVIIIISFIFFASMILLKISDEVNKKINE